ncbi:hypothetical protein CMI38_00250 [Candidatus Pacearchaeota archaeon]|nr:hypothetical protein [Candidatus Pacearchaeota archaeon]|tara:strand:- start:803 stop:1036 length:234 start_codon:yes stop_codon:yes gene_type:complete
MSKMELGLEELENRIVELIGIVRDVKDNIRPGTEYDLPNGQGQYVSVRRDGTIETRCLIEGSQYDLLINMNEEAPRL